MLEFSETSLKGLISYTSMPYGFAISCDTDFKVNWPTSVICSPQEKNQYLMLQKDFLNPT